MTYVYVAASWRTIHQPLVVAELRAAGFDVYDFRNPRKGDYGFSWSQIDPAWQSWSPEQWRAALQHPVAQAGFRSDMDALRAADAVLLVLPSGRSAHLELGWAAGAGKVTGILALESTDPDLMVLMCDFLALSIPEAIEELHAGSMKIDRRALEARP
jgi:hypothetical protein